MTHFQPGDRVTVVTQIDATVRKVWDKNCIVIEQENYGPTWRIELDRPGVTVTRVAPQPQAGEVWEWPNGVVRHVLRDDEGDLHGVLPENPDERDYLADLDFTHARCVYPPERATQVPEKPAAFQAGDVWRMGNRVPVFFQVYGKEGNLRGKNVNDSEDLAIDEITWEGAKLLFRLDQAEPRVAQPAMLRRFHDGEGDVWTEIAPGSGEYHMPLMLLYPHDCHAGCSSKRDLVGRDFGPLTDLDPVPAREASC